MLICEGVFVILLFSFIAIFTSVESKSIQPFLIIFIPIVLVALIAVITITDMNKAYVEINGDNITVVDYYLGFKKEKSFTLQEIKKAKITIGFSFAVKGYRYSQMGMTYIVFKNEKNKYMFKVLNCYETKDFFEKYFQFEVL